MDGVGARRTDDRPGGGRTSRAPRARRRRPGPPRAHPAADAGSAATGTVVRDLTLTAHGRDQDDAPPRRNPRRYRVFATREGLVGGTTANGHVIARAGPFVALPSRRALVAARQERLHGQGLRPHRPLRVRAGVGRRPVEHPRRLLERREARAVARPPARACRRPRPPRQDGYNGGKDQFGRKVLNPAGIDLADGLFWDALGLTDNAWVTVDYLWTGDSPLAMVRVDGRVDLRNAPDAAATDRRARRRRGGGAACSARRAAGCGSAPASSCRPRPCPRQQLAPAPAAPALA